jgi:hypothetical protein
MHSKQIDNYYGKVSSIKLWILIYFWRQPKLFDSNLKLEYVFKNIFQISISKFIIVWYIMFINI